MGSRAGPSRWGFWRGRVLWSQKPGAAQEFWLGLHFLGSGGRDPGEAATDTQAYSDGSSSCSRYSAPWPGSLCSASRRVSGIRDPGTPTDGEVGMREEPEIEIPGEGEGRKGDGDRK